MAKEIAKDVAKQQNEGALVAQGENEAGALVSQNTKKFNPFEKPAPVEGIVHRVGNPLEVICDCGSKGGFKFQLKEGFRKTLNFVLLFYKELQETWLFPKTYKRPQNWAILFGVTEIDKKKYFIQMLVKGESRENFANLMLKLEQEETRSIDVTLNLSFKDKNSGKGEPYKIVEFGTESLEDKNFKQEIYDFVIDNGGLEEVCQSTFLENILKNAPIISGEENTDFEGERPKYEK
jgi:hypothetical protein